jgi:SAM-dependent methyltransferase
MIDLLYRNAPSGAGRLGPIVDHVFLEQPAAQAVRNRRALLAAVIRRTLACHEGAAVNVMSIGCGPAREVVDVMPDPDARARLAVTLLDMDAGALALATDVLRAAGCLWPVTTIEANLLAFARSRERHAVPPQQLVYSIGVADYLSDRCFVRLLDLSHDLLAPGGSVVIGNFHPRNPNRGFMDHLLEWRLVHRSEEDVHALFRRSRFASNADTITFENEGINLFAECRKREHAS